MVCRFIVAFCAHSGEDLLVDTGVGRCEYQAGEYLNSCLIAGRDLIVSKHALPVSNNVIDFEWTLPEPRRVPAGFFQ